VTLTVDKLRRARSIMASHALAPETLTPGRVTFLRELLREIDAQIVANLGWLGRWSLRSNNPFR
jgi:hypothetical protein